jgi:hypothetical protein
MRESEKIIKSLAEQNNTCLLGFSRGKDSIASWIQINKFFKKVIPFYFKMIPEELSFETESLSYYEDIFKTKILRFTAPSFYRMIKYQILQVPTNLPIIDSYNIKNISYQDINNYVRATHNLPLDTFKAIGVTQNDSFRRRMVIKKNGAINKKTSEFYPIYDFTKSEIFNLIEDNNILLPKDYKVWGKTFDGLDYRFIKPLKDNFPEDYEKMKFWFPLLDLELIRYEQV